MPCAFEAQSMLAALIGNGRINEPNAQGTVLNGIKIAVLDEAKRRVHEKGVIQNRDDGNNKP